MKWRHRPITRGEAVAALLAWTLMDAARRAGGLWGALGMAAVMMVIAFALDVLLAEPEPPAQAAQTDAEGDV